MLRKWKRCYCKKCYFFFVLGVNVRVRFRDKFYFYVVIMCLNCGNIMCYLYLREKKVWRKYVFKLIENGNGFDWIF